MTDTYPGITRAALEIAYDNGALNRPRTEEDLKRDLMDFLSRIPFTLVHVDRWLATRTKRQMRAICCGEEHEMTVAMKKAPAGTHILLEGIFEEIC